MIHVTQLHQTRDGRSAPDTIRARLMTGVACATLAAASLSVSLAALGDWCTMTTDGFTYLTTARTLLETGSFPQRQLVAPPGYPVLIAPLLLLGELPFRAIRLLLAGGWAASGILTFFLWRRELGRGAAWFAAALVATNSVLFIQTTFALSEPVFTALTAGSLVIISRWWRDPPKSWWSVGLGGAVILSTYMIRTMGIVLLPLAMLALLRHRTGGYRAVAVRTIVFAIVTVGPLLAWSHRQSQFPAGLHYFQTLTTARGWENTDKTGWALQWERLRTVGSTRLVDIKATLIPQRLGWPLFRAPWDRPATWLIGLFLVGCALVRFRATRSPIDAFVILTLAMLSIWPWREGTRFITPLAPVLCGYVAWAGWALARRFRTRALRGALIVAAAAVLALQVGELAVCSSRVPDRAAKAARQMDRIANLHDWQIAHLPLGAEWLGVTPKWDNAKVLLRGSAYLSRRPGRSIDILDTIPKVEVPKEEWAIVEASVWPAVSVEWGYVRQYRVDEFVVGRNITMLRPQLIAGSRAGDDSDVAIADVKEP